jgi:hypothetical protein
MHKSYTILIEMFLLNENIQQEEQYMYWAQSARYQERGDKIS